MTKGLLGSEVRDECLVERTSGECLIAEEKIIPGSRLSPIENVTDALVMGDCKPDTDDLGVFFMLEESTGLDQGSEKIECFFPRGVTGAESSSGWWEVMKSSLLLADMLEGGSRTSKHMSESCK